MKYIFKIIFLLIAFIATAGNLYSQVTSDVVQVTLNPDKTRQQIVSISGNYCQATYSENAWDEIGDYTLRKFQPTHIRVPIPLQQWEPENDNDDPNSLMYPAFKDKGVTYTLFKFLQDTKTTYNVSNITASVWDVPDWMVENPGDKAQRKIKKEMYMEAIESISAFMYVAKSDYGIEFDYFSFNEATGGYQVLFSSEEIIEFIRMAGPYFQSMGFKTKFLVADAHSTISLVNYAIPILEAKDIQKYLGPLSYHSWWSNNLPDSEFEKIDSLGKAYQKPVWCTELGFDAMAWRTDEVFQTWDYAWKLAKITHRVIKISNAEVTQYWTYQDNFPIVSKSLDPYPSFYIMQQFTDLFPPGTSIIESDCSDNYVWVMAGKLGKDKFTVNMLNTSSQPRKINLQNIKPGNYEIYISNSDKQYASSESISLTESSIEINLLGNSMLSISNMK